MSQYNGCSAVLRHFSAQGRILICLPPTAPPPPADPVSSNALVLGDIPAFFSATSSMQTQRETQLSLGLETWLCEEWKAFPL